MVSLLVVSEYAMKPAMLLVVVKMSLAMVMVVGMKLTARIF